jgi:membrane-bound inhibitor of C-type lysozyme
MMISRLSVALAALLFSAGAASALEANLQIELSGNVSDFERRTVTYDCGTEAPLTVTYVNSAPNFLAMVTPPDETEARLFAAVLSASGARYASGQWVWWQSGPEAELYDQTQGEDADPVLSCSEVINTP